MADEFLKLDYQLVSGGTDTHVLLIDLSNKNITGKAVENSLGKAGITVNKNMVPFDERSPFVTSGIRVGTPAITTRRMGVNESRQIVKWMDEAICKHDDESTLSRIKSNVNDFCAEFPIYSN